MDIQFADIFSPGELDAIISPANSHGWMDGGIDLLYMLRFGLPLQDLLKLINGRPGRVVETGKAVSIVTGDSAIPHMICAPTVFVPGPVPQSDNAYLALSAALKAGLEQGYEHILYPSLATGIAAYRQLRYAKRWATRHAMALDAAFSMQDEGLSVYHQRHVTKGALGVFLVCPNR